MKFNKSIVLNKGAQELPKKNKNATLVFGTLEYINNYRLMRLPKAPRSLKTEVASLTHFVLPQAIFNVCNTKQCNDGTTIDQKDCKIHLVNETSYWPDIAGVTSSQSKYVVNKGG